MVWAEMIGESSHWLHYFIILRDMNDYRRRRTLLVALLLLLLGVPLASLPADLPTLESILAPDSTGTVIADVPAELEALAVKGRAPKTGYERSQFGNGWGQDVTGCDMRNAVLARDLKNVVRDELCKVQRGTLNDPYTGKTIEFVRGELTSDDVQIDHVVALSNAWQTGAQQLTYERRMQLANDPLNLLAVEGAANEQKSDSDAASWLPSNKPFRCQYVKRQIAVKHKYGLWVTQAERTAMAREMQSC